MADRGSATVPTAGRTVAASRGLALVWSCYSPRACGITLFGPASSLSFDAMHIRASSRLLIALSSRRRGRLAAETEPDSPQKPDSVGSYGPPHRPDALGGGRARRRSSRAGPGRPAAPCSSCLRVDAARRRRHRPHDALDEPRARGASMLAVLADRGARSLATLVAAWEVPTRRRAQPGDMADRAAARTRLGAVRPDHTPDASTLPWPDTAAWRAVSLPLLPAAAFWTLAATLDLTTAAQGRCRPGARHRGLQLSHRLPIHRGAAPTPRLFFRLVDSRSRTRSMEFLTPDEHAALPRNSPISRRSAPRSPNASRMRAPSATSRRTATTTPPARTRL